MKKILAITGIRSEYDILFPVIDALRRDNNFQVKLVVCGAHLSDWHGYTLNKIEEDNFEIADKIDYLLMTNRKTQRAKGVGILTYALSQTVERETPDFTIVVGDREESISTAIVCNYMDILCAHIGGGDTVFGNADDPIRFSVSRLAQIHFTFAKEYAENLIKTGEEKFRVFCVGNPAIDNIKNIKPLAFDIIRDFVNYEIEEKNYIVFLLHPLSSEKENAYSQMKIALEAIEEFCFENNIKALGIYPNTDPGSYDILKAIDEYKDSNTIRFYRTLPRGIFVNLLRNSLGLVGNSSMGILEAPSYNLPVINIGNRQKGRLNAGNVEFTNFNKINIIASMKKACFDYEYRESIKKLQNPYGNGNASQEIKKILHSINLDDKKWYIKKQLC
ncbi:MAG: UDP-N-acetylglucosamine 2-epimerase [Vulcanimicrobiota bacterium]